MTEGGLRIVRCDSLTLTAAEFFTMLEDGPSDGVANNSVFYDYNLPGITPGENSRHAVSGNSVVKARDEGSMAVQIIEVQHKQSRQFPCEASFSCVIERQCSQKVPRNFNELKD